MKQDQTIRNSFLKALIEEPIDKIVFRVYGSLDPLKAVLKLNPRVAQFGGIVPANFTLILPTDLEPTRNADTVKLW